jgi:hypothetical protein
MATVDQSSSGAIKHGCLGSPRTKMHKMGILHAKSSNYMGDSSATVPCLLPEGNPVALWLLIIGIEIIKQQKK